MGRDELDPGRVSRTLEELGRASRGPGRVYLTGGACALLSGWRNATLDVDLRLDPEPEGAFEAIRRLKDQLSVNIELASPQDFLPELPGWRDRSIWIARHGSVDFFHYDFYAQALAKLERGHDRDRGDVQAMVERGLVEPLKLAALFDEIEAALIRYPSVDPDRLKRSVRALAGGHVDA